MLFGILIHVLFLFYGGKRRTNLRNNTYKWLFSVACSSHGVLATLQIIRTNRKNNILGMTQCLRQN
jgi:hypothetical protein